ncbi:Integrin alpha-PS1 [Pseudolycoriella hygida]|uniref:Integrin alpha-PS1 n=1 Tax=Pseudolycoriella hygida TaxID=35572 RepID=A0A9Q0S7P4_9DIPT|nr:Integrin alpha-PS1 [Pseudolycoriella hygida]
MLGASNFILAPEVRKKVKMKIYLKSNMLTRHLILSVCSAVICLLSFVDSFNLESRLPIVKYGEADSYFGYSVATHVQVDTNGPDERTRWVN